MVCSLKYPVQAHEGSLLCLESSTAPAEGRMVACSRKLVISGGKDCYMKIWKIFVSSKKRRPEVELDLLIKVVFASRTRDFSPRGWVGVKVVVSSRSDENAGISIFFYHRGR